MKVKDIISSSEWIPSRRYGQDKPLISVILPTFRRGASGLFMKAARSVLNQSLSELELIIVDDASIDGTANQIKKLMEQDYRVSCIHHPENVGLPAISEYEALMKAQADYLAFAFDDDEFYPHALQELFSYSIKNDSSIIHGYVDLHVHDNISNREVKVSGFGREGLTQVNLSVKNYFSNNAVLLHRRVINNVGFYDPHVAISRVCDWDLWRRISKCFHIISVEVSVGQVLGPSTNDSLGHTYPMEHWQIMEWMNFSRNDQLLPKYFEEYDVIKVPDQLSRQTQLTIEEIRENFRNKFWYPKQTTPQFYYLSAKQKKDCFDEDGRILVVTNYHDVTTTLCFEHLPQFFQQRVRIIYPNNCFPDEMIGASAVVFIRMLPDFAEWIEYAKKMKIPHYYFLDDNFLLLREEKAYAAAYDFFTIDKVRNSLKSFKGVLLSTHSLIKYFKENNLHDNLIYYPPIANRSVIYENTGVGLKKEKMLRIAYFGGSHRHQPFKEIVFPAIREFSVDHSVELFLGGVNQNSLPTSENLNIYHFPFEMSYDLALGRFASFDIDIIVHPNSQTINNSYKTFNVLINAMAIGATPILNNAPPYDILGPEKVALLCNEDKDSWLDSIRIVYENPDLAKIIKNNLNQFCLKYYNGDANTIAINNIFKSCSSPGIVLRDVRYRKLVQILSLRVCKYEEELQYHQYQMDEGPNSFSIICPIGEPKSHIRIFKKMKYQITPRRSNWTGLEVFVGTHSQLAQGRLNLGVLDNSGTLLREISVDLEEARDNSWLKFHFPPIEASTLTSFILEFRLIGKGPQTIISFYEINPFEPTHRRLLQRTGLKHRGNELYCRMWYVN
jgi:glycosyltransferase involved in cell wall biosynthesis